MKRSIYLILILLSNCVYQQMNKTVMDEKSGSLMLIGLCNADGLKMNHFKEWYFAEYTGYEVDLETLLLINDDIHELEITIFMGTWCSDSRREVPRFYKILNAVEFPDERIALINVDRNKMSPGGEQLGMDIQLVPTFIFYKNHREVGRIIESPKVSLERDIASIIQSYSE